MAPTRRPLDSCFAKGVGAAGYLHAFMRTGDVIEIACQSMTVGHAWPITAIHVDPAGRAAAHMMPTGQVVMFYAKHHGSALLEMGGMDIPGYSQTLTCGSIRPHEKVAYVDALATADGKAVYFHAINRHFSEDVPVTVDLSEFPGLAAEGVQHLFEGRLNDKPDEGEAISPGLSVTCGFARRDRPKDRAAEEVGLDRGDRADPGLIKGDAGLFGFEGVREEEIRPSSPPPARCVSSTPWPSP